MQNHPVILFHATRREFSSGQVVIAGTQTDYYPEVLALLEQHRPHNYPSRSTCVFAAETAEAPTRFLMSQPEVNLQEIRIYRVQMDNYHRAPFRVIHELRNRIKSSGAVDQLVNEYWNPKNDWVFWEYFGPSFKVIEEVAPANLIGIYSFNLSYEKDLNLSKKL